MVDPLGFIILLTKKKEIYAEDTWEPVEGIAHLQRLLKKYHSENLDKPNATSPPVDRWSIISNGCAI